MQSLEYQIKLQLSAEQAWQKLRDISRADQYVPGITSVELLTTAVEGVGASRRVHQGKTLALDETVTQWREGEGFTLRLHRGEKGPVPPLKEAWFEYGLAVIDGDTWLRNRMRYQVGLGPLGALLDRLVLKKVVAGALRDTTIAQKLFYEGGEKVTPELLKQARKQLRQQG